MDIEALVFKHALKNALDYGKASFQSVVGKVVAEYPEVKKDMRSLVQLAKEIVEKVNKMSKEEIKEQIKLFTFKEYKKEDKKEEHGLSLPNAEKGKVKTRFAPEPAGYLHIGHAKAAWLSRECANVYEGRMVLRFDDTNPEKCGWEYVEKIKEDLRWLGIDWDSESFTSNYLDEMYDVVKRMIEQGFAYVCQCSKKKISEYRKQKKPCECRQMDIDKGLRLFEELLNGNENWIIRFKGNMDDENSAMRDPTLFRKINAEHYKQGTRFHLWPTYDFSTVFMDVKEGITHVLRSKEYELRNQLYAEICKAIGKEVPSLVVFSRLNIKGQVVGKRYIRPLVEEGKVDGWCDVRLMTLCGLRKRGIMPEAIKAFVLSFGLGKAESEPDLAKLMAENRKVLDPKAKHFFFVPNPIAFTLIGNGIKKVRMKLHPKKEIGFREIPIGERIFISKEDANKIEDGEVIRLKDFCNVRREGQKMVIVRDERMPKKKVQWVSDKHVKVVVLYPQNLFNSDGSFNENSLMVVNGIAEPHVAKINVDEIVQFERVGFFKCLRKGEVLKFISSS